MQTLHKKLAYGAVIGSCLIHVFCCGIPLAVGLANLVGVLGFTSANFAHPAWFEAFELYFIIGAGMMLAISGGLQYISKRLNCIEEAACHHQPCARKKTWSEWVFYAAMVLYLINLLLYVLQHHHS